MNNKHNLKSHLFILITLILTQIPPFLCQDQQYQACTQPIRCGNIADISYPFFGLNRPQSCGFPGFELTCRSNTLLINITSLQYRVLQIDNTLQTLRVARDDLLPCPIYLMNTTLNSDILEYSPNANDREINLLYGCSQLQIPNQYNCRVNDSDASGIYVTGDVSTTPGTAVCAGSVVARVNQTFWGILANPATAPTNVLRDALANGFSIEWSANNSRCESCVGSGGVCGYADSTSSFACHCQDQTYALTCGNQNGNGESGNTSTSRLLIAVIAGSVVGLICIVIAFVFLICRFSNKCTRNDTDEESNQVVERFILNHGSLAPKRYRYREIIKVTNSLAEKLGQGGFGSVYKGTLPDGQLVAVKVLKETRGDGEEFINEVASISRTSHVNIVNLLGFCCEKNKRALVYEYMPNKSLDKYMYQPGLPDRENQLDWSKLYEIAIGVARGLEYLHRGCNARIVHFDIKPQNILLDEKFHPKISDFGLAKLYENKQSVLSSIFGTRGTIGYIAPEVFCRNFGAVSHKSDVYSYGMMVLEMAGAKKIEESRTTVDSAEFFFPDKIYEQHIVCWMNNVHDEFATSKEAETVRKMFLIGFWCIQTVPSNRPSMSKVLEMLEGSVESIQIPPKPILCSIVDASAGTESLYEESQS